MGWNNAQHKTSWEQEHGEGDTGVFTAVSLQEGAYKGAWQGGTWNCSTSRTAGDHMGGKRDGTVDSTQCRAHTIHVSSMTGASEGWLVSRIITRQIIEPRFQLSPKSKSFKMTTKNVHEKRSLSLSSLPASLSFLISKANPTKQVLIYVKIQTLRNKSDNDNFVSSVRWAALQSFHLKARLDLQCFRQQVPV